MSFVKRTLVIFTMAFMIINFVWAEADNSKDVLANKQELFIAADRQNSLDPHTDRAPIELLQFCEGLVLANQEGEILPGVAKSWTVKDNRIYVFDLRKDAKWYDGTPVTAEDFVFTYRRVFDRVATGGNAIDFFRRTYIKNSAAIASGALPISSLGVKALNKHRLQIELDRPVKYLLQALTSPLAMPMHKASIGVYSRGMQTKDSALKIRLIEDNAKHFVCNGAYKPSSYKDGVLVAVRNKNYWNNRSTKIDKFTAIKSKSINDDAEKFLQGKLHLTYRVPAERFWILEKEYPDELRSSKRLLINYFMINKKKPPMNNPKVRKLISLAIDRNILAFAYLAQGHNPAYTFTPTNTSGFNIPTAAIAKLTQSQRNKEAQKLLKEAGYSSKKPLKFTITYAHSDRNIINYTTVNAVKRMLEETLTYVDISIEPVNSKGYREKIKNKEYHILRRGRNGNFNDPIAFLGALVSNDGSLNTDYSNPKYDKIVEEAASTLDENKRIRLYSQAEEIIANDLPVIPLYMGGHSRMVSNKIGNFPYNDPHDRYYIKDLYIRTNVPSVR